MEERKKASRPSRDLMLILTLLLLSAVLILAYFLGQEEGARVEVTVNGVRVGEYSLATDGVYPLNGGTNLLVIEKGTAYMKEASCPDATCVRTGKIRYAGQRIVCLPNNVTVKVVGEGDTDLTV